MIRHKLLKVLQPDKLRQDESKNNLLWVSSLIPIYGFVDVVDALSDFGNVWGIHFFQHHFSWFAISFPCISNLEILMVMRVFQYPLTLDILSLILRCEGLHCLIARQIRRASVDTIVLKNFQVLFNLSVLLILEILLNHWSLSSFLQRWLLLK